MPKGIYKIGKAAYNRQYYAKNKVAINARRRAQYKANPPSYSEQQRERRRTAVRKWMEKNQTAWQLRRREKKAGRPRPQACDICGQRNGRHGGIMFDHDHKTGTFRGWLCHRCNTVLGFVNDDPALLQKLIDYLMGRKPAPESANR
jgi:hypothetical protein